MKRKALIAAGIAAAVLLVAGGSVGVRQAVDGGVCEKPLTYFESDSTRAIFATDDYVDANIAERYEHPSKVNWITAAANVRPGKITAQIAVGEGEQGILGYSFSGLPRLYNIELVKECSGGEWEVVKFELAKGERPEPNSGQAPKPAASS